MSTPTATRPEVKAAAKWVRISPRKARLVVEHIRGRSVPEARTVLAFTPRAAAREVEKLLRSAVANAEANHNLIGDDLIVSAAYVDGGPMFKRWRARARGRAARIRKRTCHITLKLTPAPEGPVRGSGPGEGARGNREVSPAAEEEQRPKRRAPRRKAAQPKAEEAKTEDKPKRRAAAAKPKRTRKKKESDT